MFSSFILVSINVLKLQFSYLNELAINYKQQIKLTFDTHGTSLNVARLNLLNLINFHFCNCFLFLLNFVIFKTKKKQFILILL